MICHPVHVSVYWEPQQVAVGGWLNTKALTVAHRTLPFGTKRLLRYGRHKVVVTVNDRGPFRKHIEYDVTPAVARALTLGRNISTVTVCEIP